MAAAVATALLAVLAAWVWLERPAPQPREGASLPRLSRSGDIPSGLPQRSLG